MAGSCAGVEGLSFLLSQGESPPGKEAVFVLALLAYRKCFVVPAPPPHACASGKASPPAGEMSITSCSLQTLEGKPPPAREQAGFSGYHLPVPEHDPREGWSLTQQVMATSQGTGPLWFSHGGW